MFVVIALLAMLASGASTASAVQQRDSVEVLGAVVDFDRWVLRVDLLCSAPAGRCSGTLRARHLAYYDEFDLSRSRRVRLEPGRRRMVSLPLLRRNLPRLDRFGDTQLRLSSGGRTLTGFADFLKPRASCRRGGTTLVSLSAFRVYNLAGFGSFACERSSKRPPLLLGFRREADAILGDVPPDGAGHFVAAAIVSGDLLGEAAARLARWPIAAHTSRARRRVRRRVTAAKPAEPARCDDTVDVTDVLALSSGAVAWIEAPSDGVNLRVRAIDNSGDRLLDAGPNIAPGSLVDLGDGQIGWDNEGTKRTAVVR